MQTTECKPIFLKLPIGEAPITGKQITFEAPCNSEEASSIVIEGYLNNYSFVDALGNAIPPNAFNKGALVSVILNNESAKAFIQNPTTTQYIESKLAKAVYMSDCGSVVEGNTTDNIASGAFSHAEGDATQAGALGFRIISVEIDDSGYNHYYIVEDPERLADNLKSGDVFTIYLTNNYDLCGKVKTVWIGDDSDIGDVGTSRIGVDTIINEALVNNPNNTQNIFRVPAKPNVGYIQVADYSHAEGMLTKSLGVASHSEGCDTRAVGKYAHSEGYNTEAVYAAHSEGKNTKAHGQQSHSEGVGTEAKGDNSHTEGEKTKAIGKNSHAEGNTSESHGDNSHAEGQGTKTNADAHYSHTEGKKTETYGTASHAEGSSGKAYGTASHVEGINTQTGEEGVDANKAEGAHAEGKDTKAIGGHSHAEGNGTTAKVWNSHVQGKFNVIDEPNSKDPNSNYAHIVGNGTNDTNRSNAHTVDFKGNAWFAGDVYVGSTSGTNKDGGSKKLATEEYTDGKTKECKEYVDTKINSLINVELVSGTSPVISMKAYSEYRCGDVSSLKITSFIHRSEDNNQLVGEWSLTFKAASNQTQVTFPASVIWAVNAPTSYIEGVTYYFSFIWVAHSKQLGVWVAKEIQS